MSWLLILINEAQSLFAGLRDLGELSVDSLFLDTKDSVLPEPNQSPLINHTCSAIVAACAHERALLILYFIFLSTDGSVKGYLLSFAHG